jgi:hypothetical protein
VRFRPGMSCLGVGEGGGGAGEDARAMNQGMMAGGGRSKEGGDGGASRRAELVSNRWNEEKGGYDNRGPLPDKYLGVTWADRLPPQSGLSARQGVTTPAIPIHGRASDKLLHGQGDQCRLLACMLRPQLLTLTATQASWNSSLHQSRIRHASKQ